MSDLLYKIFGFSLIALMTVLILKKTGSDITVLLKLGAGIALGGACFYLLEPLMSYFHELSDGDVNSGLLPSAKIVFRVLGVAFLTQICASACRDCGEATMAYYVELGGKGEMLVLSLPLIKEILDTAVKLMGQ